MPTVLLLGATGLVGRQALAQLAAAPAVTRVTALVRRPIGDAPADARVEVVVTDLEQLDAVAVRFAVDAVVCALGTTIKVAGSKERFRSVDFGIPLAAATLARRQGAAAFVLVSALGASARSRVFYSRVKGELEDAVTALGFPSLTILRPSMLLGHRAEPRPAERLFQALSRWIPGEYRGIEAAAVARCAVAAVITARPGVQVVGSADMRAWERRIRTGEGA
jgi:uncharacterized protein YbjT (DUF2867 family)